MLGVSNQKLLPACGLERKKGVHCRFEEHL